MSQPQVTAAEIDKLYQRLERNAEGAGYYLNPDAEFTRELVKSLIVNGRRYGYWACPCRLASGTRADDLDIICPCDYRDSDLNDYGACYCALYVSEAVRRGEKAVGSIPERRPPPAERKKETRGKSSQLAGLTQPIWRCKVCGYLCARKQPPEMCPICKVKKDRFELFLGQTATATDSFTTPVP